MSGMLQPVGPEPARTYWIRRGILLAVVLVLASLVVLVVANLTRAAVATAPPPVIAVPPTESPTSGPTAASSSAVAPTPATPTPIPTPNGSSTGRPPVASATPTTSVAPSPAPSTTPSSTQPSRSTVAEPNPTTTIVGTPDCRPADLRVTLKGDRSLSPGQNTTFRLSLVNGGAQTCLASVSDAVFELEVVSGKDRIWSTRDCGKALSDFDKKLAAKAAVGWTVTWNGERSVKGEKCQQGSPTPKAGTYWAAAQLKGADPVRLRMIIS